MFKRQEKETLESQIQLKFAKAEVESLKLVISLLS